MLRVTVELIEHGVGEPKILGTITIVNDGTGDLGMGNYNVFVGGKEFEFLPIAKVRGHHRLVEGFWPLVGEAIGIALDEGGLHG